RARWRARELWAFRRGPAAGWGDPVASGSLRRGSAQRRPLRHAPLPSVHGWRGLGVRVRFGRGGGSVSLSARLLAAAQRARGDLLPRDDAPRRGPRRPGRAQPRVQVRGDAPGGAGMRPPDPAPGRSRFEPRVRVTAGPDRRARGPVGVRPLASAREIAAPKRGTGSPGASMNAIEPMGMDFVSSRTSPNGAQRTL